MQSATYKNTLVDIELVSSDSILVLISILISCVGCFLVFLLEIVERVLEEEQDHYVYSPDCNRHCLLEQIECGVLDVTQSLSHYFTVRSGFFGTHSLDISCVEEQFCLAISELRLQILIKSNPSPISPSPSPPLIITKVYWPLKLFEKKKIASKELDFGGEI